MAIPPPLLRSLLLLPVQSSVFLQCDLFDCATFVCTQLSPSSFRVDYSFVDLWTWDVPVIRFHYGTFHQNYTINSSWYVVQSIGDPDNTTGGGYKLEGGNSTNLEGNTTGVFSSSHTRKHTTTTWVTKSLQGWANGSGTNIYRKLNSSGLFIFGLMDLLQICLQPQPSPSPRYLYALLYRMGLLVLV
jgi:hypothetical protein